MKKGKSRYILWLALALLLLCLLGGCSSTNEQTTQSKEQTQKSAPKETSVKTEESKEVKQNNEQVEEPKNAPVNREQTEQQKPTQKDVQLTDENGKVYATAHFPITMEVQLKPIYLKIDDVHGQEIHVIQNGTDYEIGVVAAVSRSRDAYFADSLYSLLHQGNEQSVYALYPTEIPPSVTALNNPNKTKEFVNLAQQVQQILKNMSY
ncbi:hypothetical protein [Neobacillus cucumis]|uniref:hypothetical protein n=1 Tax=Neobacillus cucumis TaxID=1740721 RepID=UPI002E1F0437|nr:hypothetical protein [Neobacillus cucumis]